MNGNQNAIHQDANRESVPLSMTNETAHDLRLIRENISVDSLVAAFRLFGSVASGQDSGTSDTDVAIVVSSAQKEDVTKRVRELASSSERAMNWRIDVFDNAKRSFGYNSRPCGTLHLFIISDNEYAGNSPFARNLRRHSKTIE